MDIFIGILFSAVCFLLIVVVLLQKGRGGGLGAAFGGAGSSAFGTRTGDVFTWITIVLTVLFLLLAVGSTLIFRPPPGTVANPKFDITEPISGPTSVIITCSTKGSKIAYTTDGSEPLEEKATRSRETATVKVGQTLKARAFRKEKGWTDSGIISHTYLEKPKSADKPETKPVADKPKTGTKDDAETKPVSKPK